MRLTLQTNCRLFTKLLTIENFLFYLITFYIYYFLTFNVLTSNPIQIIVHNAQPIKYLFFYWLRVKKNVQ